MKIERFLLIKREQKIEIAIKWIFSLVIRVQS